MALSNCCLKAFAWEGTPKGTVSKLGNLDTYIAGTNPDRAVLFVSDILGWSFPNARILADHYAAEIDATVYLPDFFGGEVLPFEPILKGRFDEIDLPGWIGRNSRDIREPEIFEAARLLRSEKNFKKIGAVGFCYGGWAAFRLGASSVKLIDCFSIGHPSMVTKEDIDAVDVPVQILAPEIDQAYPDEMKSYTFETMVTKKKHLYFDYVHFPGVEHGCLTRGDASVKGEREAMAAAKDASVKWFKQFLHP